MSLRERLGLEHPIVGAGLGGGLSRAKLTVAIVVPNAATERWLRHDERGPAWIRALHRSTAPALSHMPAAVLQRAMRSQRPGMPVLGPAAATVDDPVSLVAAGPLYAGECVARIGDLRRAAGIVRTLAGAHARA